MKKLLIACMVGMLVIAPIAAVHRESTKYSRLAAKIKPVSVSIHVTLDAPEIFKLFFGGTEDPQIGGSGVIVDPRGIILTCGHLFTEPYKKVRVVTIDTDGLTSEYDAVVLDVNATADLALIQIVRPRSTLLFPYAKLAKTAVVGEEVLAVGAPLGLNWTITRGIISHLFRGTRVNPYVLQTDAPINPGNSGGPLFNMRGEIVGINVMTANAASINVSSGLGFSTPFNVCRVFLITNQHFFN